MSIRGLRTHSGYGKNARGSTLLELILYLAVFSTILLAVTAFSVEFLAAKAKAFSVMDVQRNGRFSLARLAAEVREADSLNVGASVFGSNPGILTLVTAVPATNPTVFTVTGGVLTVQQGAGAVLPLTNSKVTVTSFTVENLSPNNKTTAIRANITLTSTDTGGIRGTVFSQTFSTTERIRKNDGFSN